MAFQGLQSNSISILNHPKTRAHLPETIQLLPSQNPTPPHPILYKFAQNQALYAYPQTEGRVIMAANYVLGATTLL